MCASARNTSAAATRMWYGILPSRSTYAVYQKPADMQSYATPQGIARSSMIMRRMPMFPSHYGIPQVIHYTPHATYCHALSVTCDILSSIRHMRYAIRHDTCNITRVLKHAHQVTHVDVLFLDARAQYAHAIQSFTHFSPGSLFTYSLSTLCGPVVSSSGAHGFVI